MQSSLVNTLPNRHTVLRDVPLSTVGFAIVVPLILSALLFRTYHGTMYSQLGEFARQLGTPHLAAEVILILVALGRGASITTAFNALPRAQRWMLLLFGAGMWIGTTLASRLPSYAFAFNASMIVHMIFAATLAQCLVVSREGMRVLVGQIGIGVVTLALLTAWQFISHPPLDAMPDGTIIWQFIIPGFISVRLLGAYCGALCCFLIGWLLIQDRTTRVPVWAWAVVFLTLGFTFWSGTRAAILAMGAALAVAMTIYRARMIWQRWLALAVLAAGALAVAIALIPYDDPAFMLFHTSDLRSANGFSGGRLEYWLAVIDAIMRFQLFGAGPGASAWALAPDLYRHFQPHNVVLESLLNWGMLAGGCALSLLAVATWHAHRRVLARPELLPFLMMLDGLLAMSLVDGTLHFARHIMLAMICYAAIFADAPRKSARRDG